MSQLAIREWSTSLCDSAQGSNPQISDKRGVMICTLFLPLLTTVYFYLTLISLLTHLSHNRVLLSHTYLPPDSPFSQLCTFISHLSFS